MDFKPFEISFAVLIGELYKKATWLPHIWYFVVVAASSVRYNQQQVTLCLFKNHIISALCCHRLICVISDTSLTFHENGAQKGWVFA